MIKSQTHTYTRTKKSIIEPLFLIKIAKDVYGAYQVD